MWQYVGRRLLLAIPTLLGASIIVFAMVHLAPGDPIAAVMPADASGADIEATKKAYGFDKPLPVQYVVWLGKVVQGDLGRSIATRRAVILDVRDALINSLVLAVSSSVLAFGVGIALGLLAAFRQGKALDKLASGIAVIGVSVPHYWAGIILIIVFSVQLNWLPAMGAASDGGVIEYLRHMVLPTVALALIPLGVITRVVRSAALDILAQEFVLALRAKGLFDRRVFLHVVKNAAPQIFTVLGLQFGFQLGGSVLVEAVFSWPGTGYLLNLAIFQRDIPVLQGVILVLAAFFVLLNLLVDVLQTLVDPRIARH
ncbi:MAG: ABC transporter permease [Candidatus Rokubacteria bacterium]|nr:ABC transporter permease [Candidatus Rokubacteria bacterium]